MDQSNDPRDQAERRSLIDRLRPPPSAAGAAPAAPGAPSPVGAPPVGGPPAPGPAPLAGGMPPPAAPGQPPAPGSLGAALGAPAGAPPPPDTQSMGAGGDVEKQQRALEATAPGRVSKLRRPGESKFETARQPIQISGDN